MAKRPTGGLTLTHALTRHVHALGGNVVAVDFVRDGYDVADFLAAIKKWQLVVVEKDPGRSLTAQRSLVVDKRYNLK